MIDGRVFEIAADLIESRGLCKAQLHGPGGTISPSGAIQSAVGYREMELRVPARSDRPMGYIIAFREFCEVDSILKIDAGKTTGAEVVEKFRAAAKKFARND